MTVSGVTMVVSAKAAVECGVCGKDKFPPGTPGTVLCGRDRPGADGRREQCKGATRPER